MIPLEFNPNSILSTEKNSLKLNIHGIRAKKKKKMRISCWWAVEEFRENSVEVFSKFKKSGDLFPFGLIFIKILFLPFFDKKVMVVNSPYTWELFEMHLGELKAHVFCAKICMEIV